MPTSQHPGPQVLPLMPCPVTPTLLSGVTWFPGKRAQGRLPGMLQCNSVNQPHHVVIGDCGASHPEAWDLCSLVFFQDMVVNFPSYTVRPHRSPSPRKVTDTQRAMSDSCGANRQGQQTEGWPGPEPPLCWGPWSGREASFIRNHTVQFQV